ncbi:MAG: hypothetical protein MZU97_02350 [Bacillus subtilis]|nr:hypothetical protein [Bacillus subtilis]
MMQEDIPWQIGNGALSDVRKVIMAFLKPTYIVEHVTDINLDDLKADGIKGLLFDLDNTLMRPAYGHIDQRC